MLNSSTMGLVAAALATGAVAGGSAYMAFGPEDAGRTAQAMMVLQTMTETSGSITARQLLDGQEPETAGVEQLVREGYLKAYPENPVAEGPAGWPKVVKGTLPDGRVRPILAMPLKQDEALCDEVQRLANKQPAPQGSVYPVDRLGCVKRPEGPEAFAQL